MMMVVTMLTLGNIADDCPSDELVAEQGYKYGVVVSSDGVPDHKRPVQLVLRCVLFAVQQDTVVAAVEDHPDGVAKHR